MVDDPRYLRILFVRHGESLNNVLQSVYPFLKLGWCWEGGLYRAHPHPDAPLTMAGVQQARSAGEFVFSGLNVFSDAVFCSEMTRAIETAAHAGGVAGVKRVAVVPYFSEISSKVGRRVRPPLSSRHEEALRGSATSLDGTLFPPEVWRRSASCAGDFRSSSALFQEQSLPRIKEIVGARVAVVVGHGRFLRCLLGLWTRIPNTGVIRADYDFERRKFKNVRVLPLVARRHTVPRCIDSVLEDRRTAHHLSEQPMVRREMSSRSASYETFHCYA